MKIKKNFKNIFEITIIFVILILTAIFVFTGCQNDDSNNANNNKNNNENNSGQKDNDEDEIEDDPNAKVEIGSPAPNFKIELLDGETAKLSDYRGKTVLINFWATWCGPCVNEMPDIQELSEAYADDLIVVAINCSEKKDKVENFIEKTGYNFIIGLDETGDIQKKYPSQGIPYTIIINPEGIITNIRLGSGSFSDYEKYVKETLEK